MFVDVVACILNCWDGTQARMLEQGSGATPGCLQNNASFALHCTYVSFDISLCDAGGERCDCEAEKHLQVDTESAFVEAATVRTLEACLWRFHDKASPQSLIQVLCPQFKGEIRISTKAVLLYLLVDALVLFCWPLSKQATLALRISNR